MAGYTRQDTANNIANGKVIDADDFDAEYNAVEAAFNNTSGHTHDGTSGEGAPITVVGPAQDVIVSGTQVLPKTTNTLDLGSAAAQYKSAWFDGTVTTDILTVDETTTLTGNVTASADLSVGGNLTVTGNATIAGNLTFGDAATDTVSFAADVNSHILPDVDNTYDLGSSTKEWRNLYIDGTANIDSLVADTADINGGTLDSVTIGGTTAGAITGTTISATSFVGPLTGAVTGNLTGNVTGNADTATALATSRTISLTGDVTGSASFNGTANATITAVIQDDSHNHTIANVDGLQTALDGKLATTANAVSATKLQTARTIGLTGDVSGSVSFDGTSNATITTVIADDSHAHTIANVDGLQTALDGKLAINANAVSATKLQTSRTISLTGDVTGSVSFNGTSNVSMTTTIVDDSHSHVISNVDGLQTALDSKLNLSGGTMTGNLTVPKLITDEIQANPAENGGDLLFKSQDGNAIQYYDDSAASWYWKLEVSAGVYNERLRLTSTGLGIKNIAPSVALDVNGSIEYTGTISQVSDERLKSNKVQITGALDKIASLTGYTYNRFYEEAEQTEMGIIAQDVQAVLPVAVTPISVDTDGDGTAEEYLGVSYIQLIAPMIEAIKELKTRVEELEAQLNA